MPTTTESGPVQTRSPRRCKSPARHRNSHARWTSPRGLHSSVAKWGRIENDQERAQDEPHGWRSWGSDVKAGAKGAANYGAGLVNGTVGFATAGLVEVPTFDGPGLGWSEHIGQGTGILVLTIFTGGVDLVEGAAARGAAEGASSGLSIGEKIAGQMGPRGWSESLMKETIDSPAATHTVWDFTSGTREAATAYARADGSYVVVNDATRAVVQVSDINKVGWKPVWDDPRFQR